MSATTDESIKRRTAKRKTALVVEVIQGNTTVSEASQAFDLSPSKIEGWVDDAKRDMERMRCVRIRWRSASNTRSSWRICKRLTARPCWSCAPEKSWRPSWSGRTDNDPDAP
jgi:hypothetical protein